MYDNTWKCDKIRLYFAPKDINLRVVVVVVSHIGKKGRSRSTGVVLEVVVIVVV